MAEENGITEDPLDSESLGELLAQLAAENTGEARAALAGRVIHFMRTIAKKPDQAEIKPAAYPDIGEIENACDCYDALSRRIHQVRGICALVGHADKLVGEVADDAFEFAMWGARDLLTQADDMARRLLDYVPKGQRFKEAA